MSEKKFPLQKTGSPRLYREQFPYTDIPRILFEETMVLPARPEEIWITDTTFRDGQQARPPYTPKQILHIYRLLHQLGGKKGLIRQSEFFLYSKRDKQAVEACLSENYRFPEVTGWIRAHEEDLKLVKEMEIKETGILTSISDYHIFLKLKKNRTKAIEGYLKVVKEALGLGLKIRCHLEDVTRADIYGCCLPFAEELLKLHEESGIDIKIRLCDTMGYGVPFPGAVLPRSIPRLLHAFRKELGYPSRLLEWHGHNDFHKVHVNGITAWLYGASALNTSLLGIGERTGNPPLEAAIIEYISLTGDSEGIDTTAITEIGEYYKTELGTEISSNYPFVGSDFNTTRAGIHADGLQKNPEIYNIFDTGKILNRPLKVTVTDKSGLSGIAHWINGNITPPPSRTGEKALKKHQISKRHPGVKHIYAWVMEQYSQGRTTSISPEELEMQCRHFIPSLFVSDFEKIQEKAIEKAKNIMERVGRRTADQGSTAEALNDLMEKLVRNEPIIQLVIVSDREGRRVGPVHIRRGEKGKFRGLTNKDFSQRRWFEFVKEEDRPYYSDLFVSPFTGELVMSAAVPLRGSDQEKIKYIINIDFNFKELVKLLSRIPEEILESAEDI